MEELRQSTGANVPIGPIVSVLDLSDAITAPETLNVQIAMRARGSALIDRSISSGPIYYAGAGVFWVHMSIEDTAVLGAMDLIVHNHGVIVPYAKTLRVVNQSYYDAKYGTGTGFANLGLIYDIFQDTTGLGGKNAPGYILYPYEARLNGVAVPGVHVWITTDAAGSHLATSPLVTDANGLANFYLPAGNYFLWATKAGVIQPTIAHPITIAAQ